MISKNKIKFLRCLEIKKYRTKHQKAFLEGKRLIDEAINARANLETVWLTEKALNNYSNQNLVAKIKSHKILCESISEDDLNIISNIEASQGIIAEISISKYLGSKITDIKDSNILILDGISDPGNLGTIIRTCSWYNIKFIILSSDCVDPFNLKCLRAGMGAHFYLTNIINAKRKEIIEYLDYNAYDVCSASLEGNNLLEFNPNNKWAVILGSEAHGLHDDFHIFNKITIAKHGKIESLNASVACGIILDRLVNK